MDYADSRYRLLALFRLWNAMEYFYPYLDLLDEDWNDVLLALIPEMLEGADKRSYQLTLARLAAKLKDAHVNFTDPLFLVDEFGWYGAPVDLIYAENLLVVCRAYGDCALMPGDVILEMNGEDIRDIVEGRKQYVSVTTDEKLMNNMALFLLRSNDWDMEFTILRENGIQTVTVRGAMNFYDSMPPEPDESHELLEGNIGLINPSLLSAKDVPDVIEEFADARGIIVDLRQYPGWDWKLLDQLMDYFVNEDVTFALVQIPSRTVPGAYIWQEATHADDHPDRVYEKPVVL
jgi:C-terminal processing protease CtpA/Prc